MSDNLRFIAVFHAPLPPVMTLDRKLMTAAKNFNIIHIGGLKYRHNVAMAGQAPCADLPLDRLRVYDLPSANTFVNLTKLLTGFRYRGLHPISSRPR